MSRARKTITSLGLAVLFAACSGSSTTTQEGSGGNGGGGSGGNASGGSGGNQTGGTTSGQTGGTTSGQTGGSGGGQTGGTTSTSGSGGKATGGTTGNPTGGTTGNPPGGSGSGGAAGGGAPGKGGAAGGTTVGGAAGSTQGSGGSTGGGGSTTPPLVGYTSTNANWTAVTPTEVTSGTADVTVNDTSANQTWEGFGGAFNEIGWAQLSTKALQDEAMGLLFGTDGCNFSWGRIPMGASDYATSRYTCDDTASPNDPTVSGETARPPADTSMSKFSLTRDGDKLIPYVKAAQGVKSDLRFWASPWTPPIWMKTGYKTDNGSSGTAKKPSYFDGGNMKSDSSILTAYADYYKRFVQGYKDQGINIEIVSPQNEPGYDQNYPSCLWDKATYVAWVKTLGPVMSGLGVKVMLGTLSNAGDNNRSDLDIATAVLGDSTAKGIVTVVGVQWGVLDKVNGGQSFSGLPVWATEHKCGNYPWNPSGSPSYATTAPNNQAYGVESWGYIRDAITKGKVTSYNAWNMVLDKVGKGIDTSRDWAQDSLLYVDGGKITKTPAYYVFRHFAQFTVPGAKVVGTTGGDAVAFKNPDNSLVAVMYSKSGKSNQIVKMGGKMFQFNIPADGWATIVYKP